MRRLRVDVTPSTKKIEVKEEDGILKVRLKASPSGGRANAELIQVLADYFGMNKNTIRIIKGLKSKKKIVEVSKK